MLTNDSNKIVRFITKNRNIESSRGFKELQQLFKHLKSIDNSHDKIISPIKNLPNLQSPFISHELSIKANSLKNNHYTILTVHDSKIHVNIFYITQYNSQNF